jgi:hypothetical protein
MTPSTPHSRRDALFAALAAGLDCMRGRKK